MQTGAPGIIMRIENFELIPYPRSHILTVTYFGRLNMLNSRFSLHPPRYQPCQHHFPIFSIWPFFYWFYIWLIISHILISQLTFTWFPSCRSSCPHKNLIVFLKKYNIVLQNLDKHLFHIIYLFCVAFIKLCDRTLFISNWDKYHRTVWLTF